VAPIICSGNGDRPGHCCWINGKVCNYLTVVDDVPRCSLLLELGDWAKVHRDRRWKRSIVGQWFKTNHPGYGCGDWPQHIPEVMAQPSGRCCWNDT